MASLATRDGSIIEVSLSGTNPVKDIIFLDKLMEVFISNNLDKKNEDARKLGSRLVKLYPDDPDSYFNLGYIDFLDKDYPGAIKAFEKSMTMKDTGTLYCGPKLAIVPICMLGYACLLSDQMEKANESFDKYVELFPGDQNPYDCKADYYIATGNYEKAYESYMTAYQIDTTYKIFLQRAIDVKDREKNGGSE